MTTITAKPVSVEDGWVLMPGLRAPLWHHRDSEALVHCMKGRGAQFKVAEWRKEPTGRHEVCPACRRYVQAREHELRSLERTKRKFENTPVPETEPEILGPPADPETTVMGPNRGPYIVPTQPKPQETPVNTPKPAPARTQYTTASIFAKKRGWAPSAIRNALVRLKIDPPRAGEGKTATMLLDVPTQELLLKHMSAPRSSAKKRAVSAGGAPGLDALAKDVANIRAIVEAIARELKIEVKP